MKMKALSVRQPWASAIISGAKQIENRTWAPPEDLLGSRIWIHAARSLSSDPEALALCCANVEDLVLGAILGSVVIDSVVTDDPRDRFGPWWSGPVGWILRDPIPLAQPIPMSGRLGLWWPDRICSSPHLSAAL